MATPERILALLGLFQAQPVWTAPELAERLDVTDRTVRRDVERLRELGYAIGADRGPAGGYRLSRGSVVPPVLLTDDEAVAVALSLRTAGASPLLGDPEASLRALVKLEALLPAAAKARIGQLADAIVAPPLGQQSTDIETLTVLADAVAQRVQARLKYVDRRGTASERRVEPHRLVAWHRRWYLSAWDLDRADWRTFRLDRLASARATTFRFTRRPGEPDVVASLSSSREVESYGHQLELEVSVPIEELSAYAPYVTLEKIDATTTRLTGGADDPDRAVEWLVSNFEFPARVVGDPAVVAALGRLRERVGMLSGSG